MIARRWGTLLVVATLALAGCGGGGGQAAGGASGEADGGGASGEADGGASGAPAGSPLEFTATTVDGKPFDGRSLVGKPAVLWFWAPWCPVCLQQAPGVRKAVEAYGDRVGIVGVAGLDSAAAMPAFVRMAKVESMTHVSDEPGAVWKRFEVTAQSTFVLIDSGGTVTFRGRLDADEVPDRVAALLG